jgi:hypothetical protein
MYNRYASIWVPLLVVLDSGTLYVLVSSKICSLIINTACYTKGSVVPVCYTMGSTGPMVVT